MPEQILYWHTVKNINITSCSCERPLYLKNYTHYDLTTSDDMKFTIVISPQIIPEAEQITEIEAETLHRKWEDAKAWIDSISGKLYKTERTLRSMNKKFFDMPFEDVIKKLKEK